ncbi:MAG: PiT family inorganic phosphate transporter, partial [Parasphingorhabdus sp.]
MTYEMTILSKQRRARTHSLIRLVLAFGFIVGVMFFMNSKVEGLSNGLFLVVAAMVGAYMAINIGANDVANNVGATVGSGAITLTGALFLAGIFEASGALLAGGDVVGTIKKGIIDPDLISDPNTFIWLMMAALMAAALWLNLATAIGAPVSTTHSIVGGVLGAGIAAGGMGIANWTTMAQIAASWVISPVMGGVVAAIFLYVIKRQITYKTDKVAATGKVVPILIGIMAWAFGAYLMKKGLGKLWKIDLLTALGLGLIIGGVVYALVKPMIGRVCETLSNDKDGVNSVFTMPLVCAAALLAFAHGANDVANAVGPLAAINDSIQLGGIVTKASVPLWVMMIGALGIVVGLALYGPRLIKTVGTEITELDKT